MHLLPDMMSLVTPRGTTGLLNLHPAGTSAKQVEHWGQIVLSYARAIVMGGRPRWGYEANGISKWRLPFAMPIQPFSTGRAVRNGGTPKSDRGSFACAFKLTAPGPSRPKNTIVTKSTYARTRWRTGLRMELIRHTFFRSESV